MRKSLDTRLIDNLNKRRSIFYPQLINHYLTDDDIDRVELEQEYSDGRKGYAIYVKKLYTGTNDIGLYLEQHFNLEEIKSINIVTNTLPDFYFNIYATNEIGDDILYEYGINAHFTYKISPELPQEVYYIDGSLGWGNWHLNNPEYFMNFNGVWVISDVIKEAE